MYTQVKQVLGVFLGPELRNIYHCQKGKRKDVHEYVKVLVDVLNS